MPEAKKQINGKKQRLEAKDWKGVPVATLGRRGDRKLRLETRNLKVEIPNFG
jgi:hypothetical protein